MVTKFKLRKYYPKSGAPPVWFLTWGGVVYGEWRTGAHALEVAPRIIDAHYRRMAHHD